MTDTCINQQVAWKRSKRGTVCCTNAGNFMYIVGKLLLVNWILHVIRLIQIFISVTHLSLASSETFTRCFFIVHKEWWMFTWLDPTVKLFRYCKVIMYKINNISSSVKLNDNLTAQSEFPQNHFLTGHREIMILTLQFQRWCTVWRHHGKTRCNTELWSPMVGESKHWPWKYLIQSSPEETKNMTSDFQVFSELCHTAHAMFFLDRRHQSQKGEAI